MILLPVLLSMLDYDAPGRHIRQHKDIPFFHFAGLPRMSRRMYVLVADAQERRYLGVGRQQTPFRAGWIQ
jgi:hypothetical protein